ncbi:uncharacterized protein LOC143291387 [Babylonia areolata]|uniref:uncharacterized protein LOC143291387 n=1 Tax=Babylonia areolata TaxID=304850 RepID=UPI003FD3EC4D
METGLAVLVTSLVIVMTSCRGDKVDGTRQPDTKGPEVVNAVVDLIKAKCIFPEDRLFLRRLAYVESQDGLDPNTYVAGYDGGIWKVSQSMLNATTSCPAVIQLPCSTIRTELGIDWTQVKWTDLRKPLYSGLAASLYLMVKLGNSTPAIPATLKDQADLWTHRYHSGAPSRDFVSFVANVTQFECDNPMDIAFIVDSSGSISDADFALSLDFVAKVVQSLDVPSVVRVSAVIFADIPTVEFTFGTHSSKVDTVTAIRNIQRTSGGTATELALDVTRGSIFTAQAGARASAKRVAVLITDGQSYNTTSTAIQADRLRREAGAVVFAIGVGGYDLSELHAIASDPPCSHTYTMGDFSAIQNIIYEIERSTCKEQLIPLKEGSNQLNVLGGPGGVNFEVDCGIAYIYVSYNNPNPNTALYSEMHTAEVGRPVFLTTTGARDGQPVYLTVVGNKLPASADGLKNCSDFSASVTRTNEATIMCQESHECRRCTDDEIRQNSRVRDLIDCEDISECRPRAPLGARARFRHLSCHREYRNPCTEEAMTAGRVMFPYPYSPNMFIRCDFKGRPFVTLCPSSMTFDPSKLICGYSRGEEGSRTPLPSTYPNPCTPAHIQASYLYFEYAPDKSQFIHCDLFGGAWLEQCPVLEVWNQLLLTCVSDRPNQQPSVTSTTPAPTLVNPCTPGALAQGQYFHPYPCDHTRYLHCDITGRYYVQYCPAGMYYNPLTFLCQVGDPQADHHGCQ